MYKFTCACNTQYIISDVLQDSFDVSQQSISVRILLSLISEIKFSMLEPSKKHKHQIKFSNFKIITITNNIG